MRSNLSYLVATYTKSKDPQRKEEARQALVEALSLPKHPLTEIAAVYKMMAAKYHPDAGGSEAEMKVVNEYNQLLKLYL